MNLMYFLYGFDFTYVELQLRPMRPSISCLICIQNKVQAVSKRRPQTLEKTRQKTALNNCFRCKKIKLGLAKSWVVKKATFLP